MKKQYKAHPLMIGTFIMPFFFILVIPVVKGIYQYVRFKEINDILGLEVFIFLAMLLVAIVRCISFELIIDTENQTVTVKTGVLYVKKAVLNISKISSIQTDQNPIDALLHSVTYKINTEAGKKGKADFKFKLSLKNSKEVSTILYEKEKPVAIGFSPLKIAFLASTTSSAFAGMIIGVPIIYKAGALLGVALDKLILYELENTSSKIPTYFPTAVNTVALTILIAYAVSFIYSFIKLINFRLFAGTENLEVRSGFFVRTRTCFRKDAVKNVRIEQTPLMMIGRRYSLKANIGGYGDVKSEAEVVVPAANRFDIKKNFREYFPFLEPGGKTVSAKRNFITKSRFLTLPLLYFLIIAAVSLVLALRFVLFTRLVVFLTTIIAIVNTIYMCLCYYEYKCGKVQIDQNVFVRGRTGMRTCEFYCPKENIGEIKLIRWPIDYLHKTCRARFSVRSEHADSIFVRHLDYKTLKQEIYKNFNIEE